MPAETKPDLDVTLAEKHGSLMSKLFGEEEDEVIPSTASDQQSEDEEQEEEEQQQEDPPEDTTDDSEDEEEVDYDKPATKKKAKDEEEEEEAPPANESEAQKQARLKGREAKTLKKTLEERQTELDQQRVEFEREKDLREKAEARIQELEAARINPFEHPDFVAKKNEIVRDFTNVARRLPGEAKTLLVPQLGNLVREFIGGSALTGQELIDHDARLEDTIITSLKLTDIPLDELTPEDRRSLKPVIDRVLDVVERNTPKTLDLEKLHDDLEKRSQQGILVSSSRNYEDQVKQINEVIGSVGALSDDLIEANPYAIESVVTKLAKENPEVAKRLKAARADVTELLAGPRPLTQEEITRLNDNGTDVKAFLAARKDQHEKKRLKLAASLVQSLVVRGMFSEHYEAFVKYTTKQKTSDDELDVLTGITTKKPGTKKAPEPVKRKLGSGIAKLFPDEDD